MNTYRIALRFTSALLMLSVSVTALAGWDDWWQTPQQKAASAFEAGEYQTLLEEAPDSDWTGLGQFQSSDYQGASETFKQHEQQQRSQGNNKEATRALYNQGVSETMAGRYQQAIDNFNRVLADDPGYSDAEHNKKLAEQLLSLEQQEQQEQQGEGEDGEQDQSGEQDGQSGDSADDASGEQSDEQQDSQSEQGEQSQTGDQSAEASEGQQNSSGENVDGDQAQADDSSGDESQGLSDEQRQQDAEDAARALQAESEQQQQPSDQQSQSAAQVNDQPMSESEQATEQLLRRIPDDPAGLLRRKLEQSHRSEFPEVRDALEPW